MGNAATPAASYFLTFPSKGEAVKEEERLAVDGYKTCRYPWRGMWRVDAIPPHGPYDQDA